MSDFTSKNALFSFSKLFLSSLLLRYEIALMASKYPNEALTLAYSFRYAVKNLRLKHKDDLEVAEMKIQQGLQSLISLVKMVSSCHDYKLAGRLAEAMLRAALQMRKELRDEHVLAICDALELAREAELDQWKTLACCELHGRMEVGPDAKARLLTILSKMCESAENNVRQKVACMVGEFEIMQRKKRDGSLLERLVLQEEESPKSSLVTSSEVALIFARLTEHQWLCLLKSNDFEDRLDACLGAMMAYYYYEDNCCDAGSARRFVNAAVAALSDNEFNLDSRLSSLKSVANTLYHLCVVDEVGECLCDLFSSIFHQIMDSVAEVKDDERKRRLTKELMSLAMCLPKEHAKTGLAFAKLKSLTSEISY